MSGGFSNTAAKPRSWASAASSLPGSVMTANRAGSGWRSQAHARWLRVSRVVPDLVLGGITPPQGVVTRPGAGDGVPFGQLGKGRLGGVGERSEAVGDLVGDHTSPCYQPCGQVAPTTLARRC